jgi:hypothetical protein
MKEGEKPYVPSVFVSNKRGQVVALDLSLEGEQQFGFFHSPSH